ncbi:class II aldolase/adducin family protein [Phaeodactylibacter xiamenensis]|uniref:class II aldolase/adducin family protein n=1 Tax=Phaeodactylibacter xiamenensis TaxID=1524460 RepID=UPI003BA84865
MTDEGYIKFSADWQHAPPFPAAATAQLNAFRQELYEMGLIGAYENGIGFGNISCRAENGGLFYISGSKTGNFAELDSRHYALVTDVGAPENRLSCTGPIIASSESMSHAVIYEECPDVNGVIHVHDFHLWKSLMHEVPTTEASAPYGSPEMVESIRRLLVEADLKACKIFVMEGHEEGIFTFGKDLAEAMAVLKAYL